jgi:NAD(P)-dependent dehydrogenase (short-subunit alcohol dehydrogenase family)
LTELKGKVAWITGAGTGIGEAAALALAREGVDCVLTGRRLEPLNSVAERVKAAGAKAIVVPGDVSKPDTAANVTARIKDEFGRLDILVNNAGANITDRQWAKLKPEGIDTIISSNLSSAFYCASAAIALMRPQKNGLLIHTSSWAGRFVGPVSGPAYSASKHGVVAMSYSINMEEFMNGIRSTVLCPAEVATPILDRRPVPVSAEDRARMLQPENMADLIVFVAKQPASVCVNEVVISPTWNRGYAAAAGLGPKITP